MGFRIEDGSGNGHSAKVNTDNQFFTLATTVDKQHFFNHDKAEVYSVIVAKTPTGAGDCFLYIKNNSEVDLNISSIRGRSASAESIQVKIKDSGTPVGGSANSPVNRNAGSANTADLTVLDGVDITGLSGGSLLDLLYLGTTQYKYEWRSDIIIPKNQTLSLYAVTGAVAIDITLTAYFGCQG